MLGNLVRALHPSRLAPLSSNICQVVVLTGAVSY